LPPVDICERTQAPLIGSLLRSVGKSRASLFPCDGCMFSHAFKAGTESIRRIFSCLLAAHIPSEHDLRSVVVELDIFSWMFKSSLALAPLSYNTWTIALSRGCSAASIILSMSAFVSISSGSLRFALPLNVSQVMHLGSSFSSFVEPLEENLHALALRIAL